MDIVMIAVSAYYLMNFVVFEQIFYVPSGKSVYQKEDIKKRKKRQKIESFILIYN